AAVPPSNKTGYVVPAFAGTTNRTCPAHGVPMPATLLDSNVFKDIFTTAEMRNVFSDEFRTGCYLEIEAALAKVQGRLGMIPQEATDEIVKKCKVENIDFAKLKATTERIGYPILGVVQQIVSLCDKGL